MQGNSKRKGDVSEAYVTAILLDLGYSIYTPFGENTGSDVIVEDRDSNLYRVQIKTAWETGNGTIQFRTSRATSNYTEVKHRTYDGEVDYFAVYWPENERIYVVPFDETGDDKFTIRVEEPERTTSQINWEEDYRIEDHL